MVPQIYSNNNKIAISSSSSSSSSSSIVIIISCITIIQIIIIIFIIIKLITILIIRSITIIIIIKQEPSCPPDLKMRSDGQSFGHYNIQVLVMLLHFANLPGPNSRSILKIGQTTGKRSVAGAPLRCTRPSRLFHRLPNWVRTNGVCCRSAAIYHYHDISIA